MRAHVQVRISKRKLVLMSFLAADAKRHCKLWIWEYGMLDPGRNCIQKASEELQ